MKSLLHRSILLAILLFATPALAETDTEAEPETEVEYEHFWSITSISQFKIITDRHADDDVGSFFDQYEFTPNKSSSVPVELGIRAISFDRFGPGETPQLQFRLESPTSNLGVSGSQIDEPFFNQHADLLGRLEGLALDLEYWRFRTEDLRLFPVTRGRQFSDLTNRGDRFHRDRTGFFGDLRVRLADIGIPETEVTSWLAPELSLRGGVDARDGSQQYRFLQDRSNRWGAVEQPMDQEVAKAGGGILLAPGGLFTLTLDVDHDRFRQHSSTLTNSELGSGFLTGDDSINFIPDTNRTTATALLQSRIGERAVVEGGFQISRLKQVDSFTPTQDRNDLDDNELVFYSANAAIDLNVTEDLSVNAFVKYDRRNNKIQRNTPLFNVSDPNVQFGPFLKRWDRVYAGAEAVYALHRSNIVAIGARYEWIDRELDFGLPINRVILEPNALIADRTNMWTVYGRTNLRLFTGLGINGEVGYRGAPDTGYIVDLDEYVYGKLRASYRLPIDRTVLLSAFVNGGWGKNDDFSFTDGLGAASNTRLSHELESAYVSWGLTVTTYPLDDVSLFASFFHTYSEQNYDLILSSLTRYSQSIVPVTYFEAGAPDPRSHQLSFILGTHVRFSDDTAGSLSYSFTRAKQDYATGGGAPSVREIANNRSIEADIHCIQVEAGHWLRDGLRLRVGYRLQLLDDRGPRASGVGSVIGSINPSQTQHTVTLGVTLTNDLLNSE